jgi:hypothetical protein
MQTWTKKSDAPGSEDDMLSRKWIAAAVLAAGTASVADAAIKTTFTDGMTSEVYGATTYDFNTGAKPAGYTGDGWILPSTVPGMSAAPAGDSTAFLSVAFPHAAGTELFSASPGQSYNYFGLYWGSIDDYNWLTFYNGSTAIATVTGSDVIKAGAQLGDQTSSGANRYVNFWLDDQSFDRIEFGTSNFAFESDNHSFASVGVPEPSTFTLVAGAFAAMFFVRRRRTARDQ